MMPEIVRDIVTRYAEGAVYPDLQVIRVDQQIFVRAAGNDVVEDRSVIPDWCCRIDPDFVCQADPGMERIAATETGADVAGEVSRQGNRVVRQIAVIVCEDTGSAEDAGATEIGPVRPLAGCLQIGRVRAAGFVQPVIDERRIRQNRIEIITRGHRLYGSAAQSNGRCRDC